jgi:L-cystine transport system substrate-binding protein
MRKHRAQYPAGVAAIWLLAGTVFLFAAAGCAKSKQAAESSAAVSVINVGTMGTYEPFSYFDAAGRITGYDIEVLRLIETVDPSLKFEFHAGPWDSLFPALDAGRYQLLANQIAKTAERLKKYSLTENSYHQAVSQIIVKQGRTDITGIESLAGDGKRVGTTVGDNYTRFLEDWNSSNGGVLNIVYYEEDVTTVLQDIVNGRIDATLNDPIMAQAKAKSQGLAVEPVGPFIKPDPTFLIAKNDAAGKALIAKLDAALAALIADGRLSALSVEWFGADYTKK